MRRSSKLMSLALPLLLATSYSAVAQTGPATEQAGVVVGRLTDIEGGQLLRYVPAEKDWVVTVKDTPFGLSDTLYADPDTKAEIDLPNQTRMRIAGNTQLQAISLGEALTQVDVGSGEARFYNNSSAGRVKVTLPLGFVLAPAESVVDVHVADQSTEIVPIRGRVDFVYASNNQTYPVSAGAASLVVDSQQVTSKEVQVDVAWNDWNLKRDEFWSARAEVKGDSHTYLPANLRDDSYELDQNGRWERVYYQGGYHHFWRPTQVAAGWAPYTVGRWTDYYGDYAWIPGEPFGYVTHHYGNWLWLDAANAWYWAPPVVSVGVSFGCPRCWYPGRVAWILSGEDIGWFPLAPFEPYYCHRWWGRGSFVLRDVYVNRINVRLNRYRFARHAIIVNQRNLFGVRDYSTVRLAGFNRGGVPRGFRVTPLLDQRVLRGSGALRQRYAFTNVNPLRRPGAAALERIRSNEQIVRATAGSVPSGNAQGSFTRVGRSTVPSNGRMTSPKLSASAQHRGATTNHHAAPALSTSRPRQRAGATETLSHRAVHRSEGALRGRAQGNPPGPGRQFTGEPQGNRQTHLRTHGGMIPHNVAPGARASFFGRSERQTHPNVGRPEGPRQTFQVERGRAFGMGRHAGHLGPAPGVQRHASPAHGRSCRPGAPC